VIAEFLFKLIGFRATLLITAGTVMVPGIAALIGRDGRTTTSSK
jgi:hypothetical protein